MHLAPLQKLSITAGLALAALGVVVGVSYYYASRRATAGLTMERANANLSAVFRVVTALGSSKSPLVGVSPALARPVAEVLRTGEAAVWESRDEREQRWGAIGDRDERGARGSAIFSPMVHRETVTGVLVIGHADDHVFR